MLSIPYMPWTSPSSKVITAVYSANPTKEIVTAGMKTLSDFKNGDVTVIPANKNTGDILVRTFIWENLDNIKPIINSIDLTPAE